MMTPLAFERLYESEWTELEALLASATDRPGTAPVEVSGARLAALYRRACEHLALARTRSYPVEMIDRLARITGEAHQLIYHRRDYGVARLRRLLLVEFPRQVRRDLVYVAIAALTFLVPTIAVGVMVYWQPDLILSVVDPDTAASFESMYSPKAESIGRARNASTDWMMFGYYIRNNISVAFQCFAGGLFAGVGALFFLAYNGAFSGAIAGYLTERGLSSTFYSFIVTHAAFELTAIALAGAAGLKIGHALIAPGRVSRKNALVTATHESAVLLYGVTAMLLLAALIEAFWSSARWLPLTIKYPVAALCWIVVFAYFTWQGRRAD